jgi:UDP-N-acetylmuramoylalanine--D-glutamate ligase
MTEDRRDIRDWLVRADRGSDWSGIAATVLGLGRAGFAAADALLRVGAAVTVVDQLEFADQRERATVLDALGATVLLGRSELPAGRIDLLVPSPGLPPAHRWVADSAAGTIWSGETLAWQLRPLAAPAPWLLVTGTNGKTTTVEMLADILRASGLRAMAVGNIGRPVTEAVFAEPAYEALAVELSSFQLHWTSLLSPHAAALLNIARDHTDWHGSHSAYVADKAKVFTGARAAVVYNAQDGVTEQLARDAEVVDGCRGVGFTLGAPSVGMVGVVDDVLVDRAFVDNRQTHAAELVTIGTLGVAGSHNVANALAAAALARSLGVSAQHVRRGLTGFVPPEHRMASVAVIDGIRFVDDSKATNTHAADVALGAFERVIWIAGGLAKGGEFDDLVRRHRVRLKGVVLLGRDRAVIHEAIRRHAPDVHVIEVDDSETDPMETAVEQARAMAAPEDTVLLSPGCASMDQFADYRARGVAFQAAVRRRER